MRLWSALFGVAELCVQNCNPLAFLGGGNPNLLQAAAGILSRNSLEVVLDQSVVFPRVNCKLVWYRNALKRWDVLFIACAAVGSAVPRQGGGVGGGGGSYPVNTDRGNACFREGLCHDGD